jgi:hypothetical protein
MRFRASAVVLGLGALAATPCLALTVQSAPPRPDVAEHFRSQATPTFGGLPSPDSLSDSFAGSGRSQQGQGFTNPASPGTTTNTFSLGPLHATTTVTPGYGAYWNDTSPRDSGNPLSLTPPRR